MMKQEKGPYRKHYPNIQFVQLMMHKMSDRAYYLLKIFSYHSKRATNLYNIFETKVNHRPFQSLYT
jgi:hypothetical protein